MLIAGGIADEGRHVRVRGGGQVPRQGQGRDQGPVLDLGLGVDVGHVLDQHKAVADLELVALFLQAPQIVATSDQLL